MAPVDFEGEEEESLLRTFVLVSFDSENEEQRLENLTWHLSAMTKTQIIIASLHA